MKVEPRAILLIAVSLSLGLARPDTVGAQSAQYTAPGGGGGAAAPLDKEAIEQRMEEARWRLGPVRLAPYLGVRGLSWVENVFAEEGDETNDVTASVGAGLTAILPTGPNVFWLAQAIPEYVHWADLAERRQMVGRYGAAVHADLNRLRFTLDARRVEEQAQVTAEEPEPAIGEVEHLGGAVALQLTPRLELTADASVDEIANRAGDPDDPRSPEFFLLDRREERLRGGLLFTSGPLRFEAGAERHATEFEGGARDLSSTGTSPYVGLALTGNRIRLAADVVRRSLDPEPGSALPPTEATTGSLRVDLDLGWRFDVGVHGARSLLYSLAAGYSHFEEERYGLQVAAPFAERWSTVAFVAAGTNDYAVTLPGVPARSDDTLAYGVQVGFEIREWLSYQAGYRRLELDSNLPGLDRDTDSVSSTVSLTTGSWMWQ